MSRFDRRGGKVIHQKSITQMLLQEMKRDLNREIELGRNTGEGRNKIRDEEGMFRFNKMVKGKLAQAKLKKRARR